jgi:hypothetical protein
MRFCAFRVNDMDNMEEIVTCMKAHDADLVPECKEKVDEAATTFSEFHASCDADLTAQGCSLTDPKDYGKCIVLHLGDMSHECLVKVSDIMAKKMHPDGPHAGRGDALMLWPGWVEHLAMPDDMGPGEHHPGMGGNHMPLPKLVFASMLGALFAALVLMAGKRFVCRRRCCQRFHGSNQQGVVATGHPVVGGEAAPKAGTDYHVMA